METFRRDLVAAWRWLVARPGFAVTAVVCLALGIGANTAAFSLNRALLWRALPYREPERLVMVWTEIRSLNRHRQPASAAEFLDVAGRARSLSAVGAVRVTYVNQTGGDVPRRLLAARASASLFSVLGAEPLLGRAFTAEEDRTGGEKVVVIAESFWRGPLGADPGVLGKTLTLDGAPTTVIGVMPARFQTGFAERFELFLPIAIDPQRLPERGLRGLSLFGRLAPAATVSSARTEMAAIAAELIREHPDYYPAKAGFGLNLVPLTEEVIGGLGKKLGLLSALVALVLVIAVGNVANLLLARASSRHREVAIRTALGSERGDLLRQFLAEGLLLTCFGLVAGVGVAYLGLSLLTRLPGTGIRRLDEVAIDPLVLAFTLLLSLAVAVALAFAPFWRLRKPDLAAMFKEGDTSKASAGAGARRLQGALVTAEVALATVVLIATGLTIRSFLTLQSVPAGFDPSSTLTFNVFLSPNKYPERHLYQGFYDQLRERLATLPGVRSVATVQELPLGSRRFAVEAEFEGHTLAAGEPMPMVDWRPASPGYFQTQGVPLIEGRDFADSDDARGEQVAIISQSVARRFWPGASALGKQVRLTGRPGGVARWLSVVGVVGDVHALGLDVDAPLQVYTPFPQATFPSMAVVLRTEGNPSSLARGVREAVAAIDRDQPIESLRSMDEVVAAHLADKRTYVVLLSTFAAVALLLVAIGVHGLMSYVVGERRAELGVRIALGAERSSVFRLVLAQVLRFTAVGLAIGLALALLGGRLLSSQLYGVAASDPATLIGVTLLLLALGCLAAWLPARAALSIDPANALRRA
ncbi:MAG TPA: ABC transporter permease [Thermoanaerobaculia bacterium]|nr:ABC transporter permease [Thermoanaerobaculia bacterium]